MRLTKGERLYLLRRRLNLTQESTARRMCISHDTLSKFEKGLPTDYDFSGLSLIHRACSIRPTKGERITILRKRLGLTLMDLALQMDLSRVTLFNREHDVDGWKMSQDRILYYLNNWTKRRKLA
jgi:transcriptional regulator with XRE-family HTH domain